MRFKKYFLEIFNSKKPINEVLSAEALAEYSEILQTTDLEDDLYEWVTSSLYF